MFATEKKKSIWTRIEHDCDIDELIYGDNPCTELEVDDASSDR